MFKNKGVSLNKFDLTDYMKLYKEVKKPYIINSCISILLLTCILLIANQAEAQRKILISNPSLVTETTNKRVSCYGEIPVRINERSLRKDGKIYARNLSFISKRNKRRSSARSKKRAEKLISLCKNTTLIKSSSSQNNSSKNNIDLVHGSFLDNEVWIKGIGGSRRETLPIRRIAYGKVNNTKYLFVAGNRVEGRRGSDSSNFRGITGDSRSIARPRASILVYKLVNKNGSQQRSLYKVIRLRDYIKDFVFDAKKQQIIVATDDTVYGVSKDFSDFDWEYNINGGYGEPVFQKIKVSSGSSKILLVSYSESFDDFGNGIEFLVLTRNNNGVVVSDTGRLPDDRESVNDVAISKDGKYLYYVGSKIYSRQSSRLRPDSNDTSITVPYVKSYRIRDVQQQWETWGFNPNNLKSLEDRLKSITLDSASLTHVEVAPNSGKIYVIGYTMDGGNSLFKWYNNSFDETNISEIDKYNKPFNSSSSNQVLFYAVLDKNGKVEKGQFTLSRGSDDVAKNITGNALTVSNDGSLIIVGSAEGKFANRSKLTVDKKAISNGNVKAEPFFLVMNQTLTKRHLWGTLTKSSDNNGYFNSVAVLGNDEIAVSGSRLSGNYHTTQGGDDGREFIAVIKSRYRN